MKIFTKKHILIGVLSVLFAVCMFFAIGQFSSKPTIVSAQELITSEEIAESYAYGEEFVAPNGKVAYNGQELDATAVFVKFPDGTMKSGNTHTLSIVGKYTVIYSAVYEGKMVTAQKEFNVNEKTYDVAPSSSVKYVQDLQTTETENDGGLKVVLAEGDTFQYNDIIDVSNSNTDVPLIKLYPYSYSILAENVAIESYYTVIRLTDYYDPENYVEVSMGFYLANAATGRYHPYAVAGASMQVKSGIEPYSGTSTQRKITYIDNERYRVYYGTNDYGTMMDTTPDVEVNGVKINNFDNYGMSVYYEAKTKRIYVKEKRMHLVTDLDDASIYDRNLFEGFTTGEVILSVYANDYAKETATYEISEINGTQGVKLNRFEIADVTKPEISLSNEANNFYIAKGEEFALFSASAKDKNLVGDVKAYVYYEYGSSYQTSVLVKDGKFIPNKTGEYTVVYVAKDAFGNVAEKTVTCICIAVDGNRLASFETAPLTSARAGEKVYLNEYTLSGVNEGLCVDIYAVFNGDQETKTKIDAKTREFFPRYVGEYEIFYEYGDIIKTYVYSYKMTITASDNVSMEAPLLPKYLIKGAKYSFEPVYAETYTETHPVPVTPTVYAKVDGGDYGNEPIDYNEYAVMATESIQFKYVYQGKTILESEVVLVIDVGFESTLHLEKYFIGNCDTAAELEYVRISSKEDSGIASVDFVNAISFSQFALNFSIPKNCSFFEAVNIVFTDYYDYNKTLTIRYEKTSGGSAFSVNGSSPVAGATPFADTVHQLWYDETSLSFIDANGNAYEIENPFQSDKIYMTLEMEGVSGESAIDVYKIGSQFIGSDGYDWVSSTVYVPNAISGIIEFGTTLTFAPAQISDVLTPYLQSAYSLYVLGPNNEYVISQNGTLLDGTQNLRESYAITLNAYGTYTVIYEYRDQFGNPSENIIVLYVNDRIAPQISLANGYGSNTTVQAKLGEKITVADYTVSDNFGQENVTVVVRAVSPNNELVLLDGKTFNANEKGTWKILYYAMDAEGNYVTAYYTIHVA